MEIDTMANILIADDDEVMRALFKGMVTKAGHEATICGTSQEAIRIAEEIKPDLIITDIFIPEEGGLKVISHLKEILPDIKIIAISGFDTRQDVDVLELARHGGADETFQKPVHAQILSKTIKLLLEN
jgi:CheY-like chemotaxis protein